MPYKSQEEQREYQRLWMKRRRDSFFKDKFCIDCDSSEKLELDHVDPTLKVSHRIWSWSDERRFEELKKCVVRCHKCHVDKSSTEGSIKHPGIENGGVKLTPEKVLAIIESAKPHRDAAREFDISETQVRRIRSGVHWTCLRSSADQSNTLLK